MEKGFRFPGVNNWIVANNIYNVNSSMKSLKCSQKKQKIVVKVQKKIGKKELRFERKFRTFYIFGWFHHF